MALIRGVKANYPCPVCLMQKEELSNLSKTYELQTTTSMQGIWSAAQEMNATQREQHLREHGLRDIQVAINHFYYLFWFNVLLIC
jgi:hypothetical protein